MNTPLAFDPLLPVPLIIALTVLCLIAAGFSEWKGLHSFIWRAIAAFILCGALLNPQKLLENRAPLADIVVILADKSESMQIGGRAGQALTAEAALRKRILALGNTEIIQQDINASIEGTRLTQSLIDALGRLPSERLGGVFAITDGQVHDVPDNIADLIPSGVPFHGLMIGERSARDRRLETLIAPKFGLVGENVEFAVRVEDPGHEGERAGLEIRMNGERVAQFDAQIRDTISIPLEIEKRGVNTVEIRAEAANGELTLLNNAAVFEISGVRDRMRVLLITGEPHIGGRAWRNLLKSDPSVDLVQFSILTNPGIKNTGARPRELSLIQFPERELFQEQLTEFDLIIFDQFRRRSVTNRGMSRPMLHPVYIANIAAYVENGGALLVATGPAFAGKESLALSPLITVLPAHPTGETLSEPFRPTLSEKGRRHPITSLFHDNEAAHWGQWYRTIETKVTDGDVLMVNQNNQPLLVIDKIRKGRTAMLLSDQAWLWAKNHNGGGPYNEMFRRLSHWLMGEPDLEADRLRARVEAGRLFVEYQSLDDKALPLTVARPDGSDIILQAKRVRAGLFSVETDAETVGNYRITAGDLSTFAAAGVLNPTEYKHILPTENILAPLVKTQGGGSFWLGEANALPEIRKTKFGAGASGENWAGLATREQYNVTDLRRTPFGPTWLYFILILLALLTAWRLEGR